MNRYLGVFNLIFILIILIAIGCKEKDCHKTGECPPEYYRIRIGEEPKSYLWALPGSYWIYKNSMTGDLDTQLCTDFIFDSITTKGTQNYSKFITVEYDAIRRIIQSSFRLSVYTDQTTSHNPNESSFNNGRTVLIRDENLSGENIPLFYPFNMKDVSGTGLSNTSCIGFDSLITIQGKSFFNVVRFEIDRDQIDERKFNCIKPNVTYYWAKDIGLVKREMKSCGYSWELIEYKIIK